MNLQTAHVSRPSWRPADTRALILITVFAGLIRIAALGTPEAIVFDESYYAQDACWYLTRSEGLCTHRGEASRMHPPLGKWLTAAGIRLFGYTPFGWRVAVWAAGTLSIALLYLLARRLLGSTTGAAIASGLLAVDFLHFIHSRIAMLDIFVTAFGLAAFLFAVYDHDSTSSGLRRPWRLAAGIAAGAAVASKWSGVSLLAGVIALTLWWETHPAGGRPRGWTPGGLLVSIGLPLVVAPVLVYAAAHIGRVGGDVFAPPWDPASWWYAFLQRQWFALRFHTGTFPQHPYQSPAWSWLLLRRPVLYFFAESGREVREILALGNPLVWWSSIPALGAAAVHWIRRRGDAETVILVGFAASYLPWLLFDRLRTFVFLFYLLPAVPFLCLALARAAVAALGRPWGRVAAVGFGAATVALLLFFYPLLTARPLSAEAWAARVRVFADCGSPRPRGSVQIGSVRRPPPVRPGPPPRGWCWI